MFTLAPEWDLVNEIEALLQNTVEVDPTHVKGHQDTSIPYEDLPFQAQCNVDCDELCTEILDDRMRCYDADESAPTMPNNPASVQIDAKSVTKKLDNAIRMKKTYLPLRKYIIEKARKRNPLLAR